MQRGRTIPWGYLALAGALLLAAVLVVVQSGWLDGDDEPGVATAPATPDTASVPLPPTATPASATSAASTPAAISMHPACAQRMRLSTPPSGLLIDDPAFTVWFGEPGSDLAVAPRVQVRAPAGSNSTLPDTGAAWFAGGPQPMRWYGAEEPLTIAATLLDDDRTGAGTAAVDIMDGYMLDQFTQDAQVVFPQPGCWEVTASAGEMQTTIPILVAPVADRPDVRAVIANRATQPYVPPTDCPDPAWTGPSDPLNILWAGWWIEAQSTGLAQTIALGSDSAVFWVGRSSMFRVRYEDDPAWVFAIEAVSSVDGSRVSTSPSRGFPGHAVGALTFPHPGCWEVSLLSGGLPLMTITTFVYPADCRRESATMPVPDDCTVLAGNP